MKTAMQELEDKLKDNLKWIVMNADYELMDKLFKEGFEKEKKHIIDFHVMLMKKGLEQEGNKIEWDYDELKKEAEEYYNQTYNQKK